MRTDKQQWSREGEQTGWERPKHVLLLCPLLLFVGLVCVFLLVVGVSLFLDGLSSPSQGVCVQSRDTQAERPEDKHAHGTPPAAPYSSYL